MPASLTDYLAAERTFLTWIRTGLALAGFGFVIARFGLFLRAMGIQQGEDRIANASSPWVGAMLILLGSLVLVSATWNYLRLIRRLEEGRVVAHRSWLAIVLAILLAVLGLALAVHLFSVRAAAGQPATEVSMSSQGIVNVRCHHPVEETVHRVEQLLAAKDVKLFTVIDHSGEAERAGYEMRPCKLLIFGNPKAGTPVMLASPSAALDLPLKILVWEKADGTTWISYNEPAYLQQRHAIPDPLMKNISVIEALAAKAAE